MTNDNMTPESSRGPLRRLLIVLLIVVGVAIYAYGWNATDISLDEVQDPVRQASVSRALRELLSPDLFARDRTQQHYATPFTVGCSEGESTGARRDDLEDDAYIIITPGCADQDEIVNIEGYHLPANAIAGVYIRRDNGQTLPFKLVRADGTVSEESTFDVDNSGYFNIQVKVPRGRGISNQTLPLEVQTISPTGWPRLSQTTNTVIEKMVETIFLALMATTLAVPISIAISFLAARNLMRQVHLPLGNVLVGVVLLPVGAALGYLLVGPLGRVAVNWGKDLWLGLISPVVMVATFGAVARMSDRLQLNGTGNRIRSLLMNLLLFMAIIFVLGALGGLLVWLGGQFTGNVTRYFGNFVGTIGELIDLTIEWFAALGGAVIVASVGATWSAVALRAVRAPLSNVLGGVLGALSGAILLGSTAFIGTQAVLLGLLTAIVAAVLGGQATVLAYERLFRRPSVALRRRRREDVSAEQAARSTLFIIGAILTFLVAAYVLDLLRAIVDERPPSARMMDLGLFQIRVYIAQAALMGAVLGGLAGGRAYLVPARHGGLQHDTHDPQRAALHRAADHGYRVRDLGRCWAVRGRAGADAALDRGARQALLGTGREYRRRTDRSDPIDRRESAADHRLRRVAADCAALHRVYDVPLGHQRPHVDHHRLRGRWWYRLPAATADQPAAL